MKRRGFFGALATLLTAPVAVTAKPDKTEKHWICLNCGEPLGAVTFSPESVVGHQTRSVAVAIRGEPRDCPNCGASICCTAWR